jgi:hypothetical protein
MRRWSSGHLRCAPAAGEKVTINMILTKIQPFGKSPENVMAAGSSQSVLGPYLALFASAEIFIFVFIEIATKIDQVGQVIITVRARREENGVI